MAVLPARNFPSSFSEVAKRPGLLTHKQIRARQVVNTVLLVIVLFQLAALPGAIMMHSTMDIATALLGLALCGAALVFKRLGQITVVSILLIIVIDLGCGLMLLTSPMGLDVGSLPVFDVLIISELIAVSLLPPITVFPIALGNILFILADLALQPRTAELNMLLTSNMGYNAVLQPVSLQIVVAVVSYIWVRNALHAIARADRAEEIAQLQSREAELQRREAERTHQLDLGSSHLLEILVRAANGDRTVRVNLHPNNVLWRIGGALNLLLIRLRRVSQTEDEIRHLREANARLSQLVFEARMSSQHTVQHLPPSERQM
ncbi:MAG: hypothetical protein M3Z24_00620 [Chloroflexota bacterium]|nr:hypothetical protein [Chloroflexota bacterium]